jgi:PIN domain nuclease of toxin-antitoxin system
MAVSARGILLDTTYLLPVFGIDVEVDSAPGIHSALERLRSKGVSLHISDLSPFEAFIKSFRIAEKLRDEDGKRAAKSGFLVVVKGDWVQRVDHKDEEIIEEAFRIRLVHNDPFDCFIFATAKVLALPLVTEDGEASRFLDEKSVLTWTRLKRHFRL